MAVKRTKRKRAGTSRKQSRKRTATKKAPRQTRKTTKRKATKTIKKKYSYYSRSRLSSAPRMKTTAGSTSLQPLNRRNPSKNPVAASTQVLAQAKKHYGAIKPKEHENRKKRNWAKFKKETKKIKDGTKHIIEETGKALDKAGAYAEAAAPSLTLFAAENPEMPFLGMFAGAVDTAAGIHRGAHKLIDDAQKAMIQGDSNRQGIKEVTHTKKYQKLMADVSDEDYRMAMYQPESIDGIPVADID